MRENYIESTFFILCCILNEREFKPKYKFFSWIYKIAINESYNTLKKRQQLNQISEELKSNDKNPEEKYRDTERSEKIQEALNKLSIDYRAIIVLCYFYGQSYSDIGYILDIPENKVKSRLFTARQLLRDLLIKEDLL
ncbi:MAG: RNA polymerase sigma factor [Ignavibacteriales bacterium]|nr:RNA polymerase sigma factor [Ignavibacteriales bacterium]